MTVGAALASEPFRLHLVIIAAILLVAGATLGPLTLAGRNVGAIWKTDRGWLITIPLAMGAFLLGREATIIGVTLLALAGFKEFAQTNRSVRRLVADQPCLLCDRHAGSACPDA